MADGTSSGKTLLERLQIGVSILLALAAGYSAWQMNATEKSLKETERSLKTRESERKDSEETRANRESIEKKQLLVYDAVVKSLESGDAKKQSVSKALVTALLEDPLRTELLVVLTTSAAPEIKKEAQATIAQESTFKAEEHVVRAEPRAKPTDWADWDFDIFWCERSGSAAQAQAEKMKKQLDDLEIPSVREMLDIIVASGGHLWGCKLSFDMNGLGEDDLYEGVEAIISAADFIELSEGAQIIFV